MLVLNSDAGFVTWPQVKKPMPTLFTDSTEPLSSSYILIIAPLKFKRLALVRVRSRRRRHTAAGVYVSVRKLFRSGITPRPLTGVYFSRYKREPFAKEGYHMRTIKTARDLILTASFAIYFAFG